MTDNARVTDEMAIAACRTAWPGFDQFGTESKTQRISEMRAALEAALPFGVKVERCKLYHSQWPTEDLLKARGPIGLFTDDGEAWKYEYTHADGVGGKYDLVYRPTIEPSQAPLAHDLYKTGDPDAPDVIKDRNGEVVLGLCRVCGRGETELSEPCAPAPDELEIDGYLVTNGTIGEWQPFDITDGDRKAGFTSTAMTNHANAQAALTALRAECERLERERDAAIAAVNDEMIAHGCTGLDKMNAKARVAELEKALEPFSQVPLLDQTPDAPRGMWVSVPFGWLQDARAALSTNGGDNDSD